MNTVEVVYPLSGDLAVGMLYSAANVLAVPLTFIGQILLDADDDIGAPLFPYGIWFLATMTLGFVPVLIFQGSYMRLREDKGSANAAKDAEVVNALVGNQEITI